jgi:hypothetical protein
MPASYVIDRKHRIVFTTFSGVLIREEVEEHIKKLRRDPDFDPSFSELIDLTKATKVELRYKDFDALSLVDPFPPQSKRACVVPSQNAVYGSTRMFQTMREGNVNIAIFKTVDEALAWLHKSN